jgi:hypothetical protein
MYAGPVGSVAILVGFLGGRAEGLGRLAPWKNYRAWTSCWFSCQGRPTLWAQVMDCLCHLLWLVEHSLDELVIRWDGCLELELPRGCCVGGGAGFVWHFVLLKNCEGVVTPRVALVDGSRRIKHFWCCTVAGRWAQHPCILCRGHPHFWANDDP